MSFDKCIYVISNRCEEIYYDLDLNSAIKEFVEVMDENSEDSYTLAVYPLNVNLTHRCRFIKICIKDGTFDVGERSLAIDQQFIDGLTTKLRIVNQSVMMTDFRNRNSRHFSKKQKVNEQ
jgi:hypothetical protein